LQRSAQVGVLTDSSYVQLAHHGVAAIDIGFPCRYTRADPRRYSRAPDAPLAQKDLQTVNLAKQVTVRDMPLQAEAIKQRLLHHPPLAHHRPNLPLPREGNQ
jgi:hypothetical protein